MFHMRARGIIPVDSLHRCCCALARCRLLRNAEPGERCTLLLGEPGDLAGAPLCSAIYVGFGFIFSFGNSRLN